MSSCKALEGAIGPKAFCAEIPSKRTVGSMKMHADIEQEEK
jgi:hypothetical protein